MKLRSFPQLYLWFALAGIGGCDQPTGSIPAAAIELSAPTKFIDVGQSVDLAATALDAAGAPLAGKKFDWASSNEQIASVAEGRVTGKAPGPVVITAFVDGTQAQLEMTVEIPVAALEIGAATKSIVVVGGTTPIVASTRDDAGKPFAHSIIFSSLDTTVATVSDSGMVRGRAPGTARIRVTAGAQSKTVEMSVERPYTLTPLGAQTPSEYRPLDINEAGQVVGTAAQAFLWHNGQLAALGLTSAYAINDHGHIAGSHDGAAVVWRNGAVTVVYSKAGGSAWAAGINNQGHVVGSWRSRFVGTGSRAEGTVFLHRDGATIELVASATNAEARAINETGWVVADTGSYHPNNGRRALLFRNGESLRIGAGTVANAWELTANDVNDRGQVVGGPYNAYVWKEGVFTNLDPTPNQLTTEARSINEEGVIVGWGQFYDPLAPFEPNAGAIWRSGHMTDLNDLLVGSEWKILRATAINNRGQIVGWAKQRTSGLIGAVLLNPPAQ